MCCRMKTAAYSLVLTISFLLSARADLTIVQKVERAGSATNMTIKLKGDKVRIEASPQVTTIIDGKTGEITNLMNDQKTVVRISAEKAKAVTNMINKFDAKKEGAGKVKLTPTGQKETVDGYETEQYTYDGPDFKATYWIASNYPEGAAILAQLQSIKSEFWDAANAGAPDLGAALGGATEITTTIISANQNPISDAEFTAPNDFKETKLPDIFDKKNAAPSTSPNP